MKVFLALVIILCTWQNVAAEEIRLDSLWAKQGGVAAMIFTPDSKSLLIGEDGEEGQVTVHNVTDGSQRAPFFLPPKAYADFKFTPDGKYLVVSEQGKVVLLNPQTFDSVGVIENVTITGNVAFSDDSRYAVIAGMYSSVVVIDLLERIVKAVLYRPSSYVPDQTHPTQTAPYWNGKVCFSPDSKYIIGKYENSLVRWDWGNTPTQQEIIIGDIGNRALIGFSPDKKYFVQQSNYIWDLIEKKQIIIEGMQAVYQENNYNTAFSIDNKYLFCVNEKLQVNIVSLAQKKVLYNTEKGAKEIAVSNDNQFLSYRGVGNRVRTFHITWDAVSVHSEEENTIPLILIKPQPGNEYITIEIETPKSYTDCKISVVSSLGSVVGNVYQGDITNGKRTFIFPTTGLSSGQYTLLLSYKTGTISTPFIITK